MPGDPGPARPASLCQLREALWLLQLQGPCTDKTETDIQNLKGEKEIAKRNLVDLTRVRIYFEPVHHVTIYLFIFAISKKSVSFE